MIYKAVFAILSLSLCADTLAQKKSSGSYEAKIKELARLQDPDINFEDKKFVEEYIKIYQKYLSEKEVEELVQFYRTPLGQKLIRVDLDLTKYVVEFILTKREKEKACWDTAEGIIRGVKQGIQLFRANEEAQGRPPSYPKELDESEKEFFGAVLIGPVATDSNWTKKKNTYTVQCGGKQRSFTYHPESGEFE